MEMQCLKVFRFVLEFAIIPHLDYHRGSNMSQKILKKTGIGLLLIPLVFLLIFIFGEVFSGKISGISHLIQAAPLLLLIIISNKKPFWGGIIISIISLILGIFYTLRAHFSFQTVLLVELFLFIPPFIAGILLIMSSRK